MGMASTPLSPALPVKSPESLTSSVLDWLDSVPAPLPPRGYYYTLQGSKRCRMDDDDQNAPSESTTTSAPAKKRRTQAGPSPSVPHMDESPTSRPTRLASASSSLSSSLKSSFRSLAKMEQLELADPKVIVGDASPPPALVRQLWQLFQGNRNLCRFVPNIPDVLVQFDNPQQVSAMSIQSGNPTVQDQNLFNHALNIWRTIQFVSDSALDEQNWYPSIHAILEWPLPPSSQVYPPQPLLSVIEAQNSLFDTSFIPKRGRADDNPVDLARHIGGVKVDHLLTVHAKHPQLSPTHDSLRGLCYRRGLDEHPPYSPLSSVPLKRRFIAAVVEVKALAEPDTNKALSQTTLATSAVLECLKRLRVGCGCERRCKCIEGWDEKEMLPVMGFVVDRRSWMLRISYWETKDQIRITESVQVADMSTFEGVCRLLRLVEAVKSWVETTMVPFLIETMEMWTERFGAKDPG